MKRLLYLFVLLFAGLTAPAQTTFDDTAKFAWGGNTGWISFRHDQPSSPAGVVFGGAFLSGYAWSANTGWIDFGDGTPDNGHTYANDGSDHGVNHDGAGNLSGFAWSANTGWINFGWAVGGDPNRPRVNLLTGEFSGYAWGANTGWINLGTGLLATRSMHNADADGDGIADWWEWRHFGTTRVADATSTSDTDNASDLEESLADTNPTDPDSVLRVLTLERDESVPSAQLKFTSTPTRLYRIEYTEKIGPGLPWTPSALGLFGPDAGSSTTRDFACPAGERKYFRVGAVVPLQSP